jgi:hypothetical protein
VYQQQQQEQQEQQQEQEEQDAENPFLDPPFSRIKIRMLLANRVARMNLKKTTFLYEFFQHAFC